MQQYGLIKYWEKKFYPQPQPCMTDSNKQPHTHRISLTNLGGAFAALLIGYALALIAFIMEHIVHYYKVYKSYHLPCPLFNDK